jgi:ribosomal protein S18 acetylase RimI-like enzyme
MTESILRRMVQDDAAAVAQLLQTSFDEPLSPFLVYCQPGIDTYLVTLLDWSRVFQNHHLYVATNPTGELLGFAEFRSVGDSSCLLSWICVARAARGVGLAERLILLHLDTHPEVDTVELDVFAHNATAIRLYERLGFTTGGTARWWRRALPKADSTDRAGLRLSDWHASAASLDRYGFCQINAEYRGHPVRIGLTSSTVVRVDDREQFQDDNLLAALRFVLPDAQHALIIDRGDTDPNSETELLLKSQRMRAMSSSVKAARR